MAMYLRHTGQDDSQTTQTDNAASQPTPQSSDKTQTVKRPGAPIKPQKPAKKHKPNLSEEHVDDTVEEPAPSKDSSAKSKSTGKGKKSNKVQTSPPDDDVDDTHTPSNQNPSTPAADKRRRRAPKPATPKAAPSLISRDEAIKHAIKNNPSGARILEPSVVSNASVLARYFRLDNTKDLAESFDAPTVKGHLTNFDQIRISLSGNKNVNLQAMWALLVDPTQLHITQLNTIQTMSVNDPVFKNLDKSSSLFTRSLHIALIFILVRENPLVFRQAPEPDIDPAYVHHAIHIEDQYRAYIFHVLTILHKPGFGNFHVDPPFGFSFM